MKSEDDELTEDELEQSADWDSRNFGDEEFLPNGGRYQVNISFEFLNNQVLIIVFNFLYFSI